MSSDATMRLYQVLLRPPKLVLGPGHTWVMGGPGTGLQLACCACGTESVSVCAHLLGEGALQQAAE